MNAQDTAKNEKSINIGAGTLIAINKNGNIQGLNLKVNKIFKQIFLLGVSADIGIMDLAGTSSGSDTGNPVYGKLYGTYFNFFSNTTYYITGNATTSKIGIYGKFGLGVVWYKTSQSNYFEDISGNDKIENTSLCFSSQISIGGDVKLGKGRLFVEIVSTPPLFSKIIELDSNSGYVFGFTSDNNITTITKTNLANFSLTQEYGIRIGYALRF